MAVLADRSEVLNDKPNVIGIFQSVLAPAFPTTLTGVLVIRIALEDDEPDGAVDLGMRFVRGRSVLAELGLRADVAPATPEQPLRGLDLTVDLMGTLVPEPGLYAFEIRAGGRLLTRVPFSAQLNRALRN